MPRYTKKKVGEVHRVNVEKTFLDHVKETIAKGLQIAGGIAVLAVVIAVMTK